MSIQQTQPGLPSRPTILPQVSIQQTSEGLVLVESNRSGCNAVILLIFGLLFFLPLFWGSVLPLFRGHIPISDIFSVGGFFRLAFLLFGVGLLVLAGYQILLMLTFKKATLLISEWPLRLGSRCTVQYRCKMSSVQVQRIEAWLALTEEISYSVGTSTSTEKAEIWRQALPDPFLSGSDKVDVSWVIDIPRNQPSSFHTSHNKLIWSLNVQYHTKGLLKHNNSFILVVLPEVLP